MNQSRARKVHHSHDILTTDDIAGLFQLNPKTVERLARKGSIPARQVANKWRFSRQKLLAYVTEQADDNK
jgi:excisionase family DNA binding protein